MTKQQKNAAADQRAGEVHRATARVVPGGGRAVGKKNREGHPIFIEWGYVGGAGQGDRVVERLRLMKDDGLLRGDSSILWIGHICLSGVRTRALREAGFQRCAFVTLQNTVLAESNEEFDVVVYEAMGMTAEQLARARRQAARAKVCAFGTRVPAARAGARAKLGGDSWW